MLLVVKGPHIIKSVSMNITREKDIWQLWHDLQVNRQLESKIVAVCIWNVSSATSFQSLPGLTEKLKASFPAHINKLESRQNSPNKTVRQNGPGCKMVPDQTVRPRAILSWTTPK